MTHEQLYRAWMLAHARRDFRRAAQLDAEMARIERAERG
jgi:hypothetical protein